MAKAAPKKAVKPATKTAKPGRRSAAVKPTKVVKAAAPAKKPAPTKAPVVSKDELRLQLEKGQSLIAALRAKGREATRAAKASAAQIAELEAKVAQLEKKLSAQEKSASPVSNAEKSATRGRKAAVKADVGEPAESANAVSAETDQSPAD